MKVFSQTPHGDSAPEDVHVETEMEKQPYPWMFPFLFAKEIDATFI
jgi:hypothetical protein